MSAHKIVIEISGRAHAHAVAVALQDLVTPAPNALTLFEKQGTCNGADQWQIEAYFEAAPDPIALHAQVESLLDCKLPPFELAPVPDLNWVAISQKALPPVLAGRFAVHGGHDRARIPQGPNAIEIEAGEAFGTAHHATTYGCLLAIDRLTRRRAFSNVLDLGCGSGVLAIALARALPKARILATDLDARSVAVARENMRVNGEAGRITALQAAGLAHSALRRSPAFDLVVANILAEPLIMLAPQIARKLEPGGALVLSGILSHQSAAVIAAYRTQGLAVVRHDRVTGWSALQFVKRGIAPARPPA